MKLYLLSHNYKYDYHSHYNSCVVCAESEEEAKKICPDEEYNLSDDCGFYKNIKKYDSIYSQYYLDPLYENIVTKQYCDLWPPIKHIKAKYLGEADSSINKGVVHSSCIYL